MSRPTVEDIDLALSDLVDIGCDAEDHGDGRILVTYWPDDAYDAPDGWEEDGADDQGEYLRHVGGA